MAGLSGKLNGQSNVPFCKDAPAFISTLNEEHVIERRKWLLMPTSANVHPDLGSRESQRSRT